MSQISSNQNQIIKNNARLLPRRQLRILFTSAETAVKDVANDNAAEQVIAALVPIVQAVPSIQEDVLPLFFGHKQHPNSNKKIDRFNTKQHQVRNSHSSFVGNLNHTKYPIEAITGCKTMPRKKRDGASSLHPRVPHARALTHKTIQITTFFFAPWLSVPWNNMKS